MEDQKPKEKDPNNQYEDSSQCQDFEDYGPEGYHPVYLGERFNNSAYQVIQKVGWGHFSTVWLVQSLANTNQYFALKVQRSKDTHAETAIDELNLLKILMSHQKDPAWQGELQSRFGLKFPESINMVEVYRPLLLVDNFIHYGMHGKHYCSVFELMGPNLLDLIQHYEYSSTRMPLWLVKQITRDVLVGMVYMHQHAKMIHTDIKPQNIMMKLPESELATLISNIKEYKTKPLSMKYLAKLQSKNSDKNKKKYEKKKLKKKAAKEALNKEGDEEESEVPSQQESGQAQMVVEKEENTQATADSSQKAPETVLMVEEKPAAQEQQVQNNEPVVELTEQEKKKIELQNLKWKQLKIKINDKLHFKIADFGNATLIDKHFTEQIQTREYRSPEVIVGSPYNETADVWSLACMIFEMMTNTFLFKPKEKGGIGKDEDHLYKMMEVLEIAMPKLITSDGTQSRDFFNKKGDLLHGNPKEQLCISRLLHEDFDYVLDDAIDAQTFLEPMLHYDPAKRVSARECLKHEWLWS